MLAHAKAPSLGGVCTLFRKAVSQPSLPDDLLWKVTGMHTSWVWSKSILKVWEIHTDGIERASWKGIIERIKKRNLE